MDRVAEVLTEVGAVAVLGVLGSAVAELAVAVLDRSAVWDGLTVTTSVMSGALVTPRLARVQVTVVVAVDGQRVRMVNTMLVPVRRSSETETELATEGPALLTDRV